MCRQIRCKVVFAVEIGGVLWLGRDCKLRQTAADCGGKQQIVVGKQVGVCKVSWGCPVTVVLYKEGKADYLIPRSYRPIALENTLSKILERVIVDYIVDIAKEYTLLL